MYWVHLITVNIAVYFLLGWLIFDTKDKTSLSFQELLLFILKGIFVSSTIRTLRGDDDCDAVGMMEIAMFFIGCGG